MTMVQVTHDQREAVNMADTIVLMNEGKIAAIGSPHHLYESPPDLFTASFIGSPKINLIHNDTNLFARLKAFYQLGDAVKTIAVRPQNFIVEPDEDGLCEVIRMISGNGNYEIYARCLDQELLLITPKPLAKGARFKIGAARENLLLFDENGLSL